MKTDGIFFVVLILAVIGVIVFSLKPKVCVDKISGNARSTYRIFPCASGESAVIV